MLPNPNMSQYSPDGKLFATINEHGILKIWDTETSKLMQEYAPNLHLSSPCTCLTWLTIDPNIKSKKSKKSRKSMENENSDAGDQQQQLYIAFGTSTGGVSLYSFAKGEVERNLKGEGHSGRVTCLVFDDRDVLYTGGEDCILICWSLSNEKRIASWPIGNERPTSLAYLSESQRLVIGARQLKIFSLEKQELVQAHVGHSSDITIINVLEHNTTEYCLTASKTERVISLWTLKEKNKYRNATGSFIMEDAATCLSYKFDKSGEMLKIGVVTRSGVIHIYNISMDLIKADKSIKPSTTIRIASDDQTNVEPIMAVTASIKHGSKSKELLYGYGDDQFLVFEKIGLNFSEHIQVLIRSHPKKSMSKASKQSNEAITKTLVPNVKTRNVQYQTSVAPGNRKAKDDIPLENRLQNLNVTNGEMPNAQSKVQLLMQALHSKDASLLNTVLSTEDQKVINLTLKKLPVQYVASLVNELTLLMEKKHLNVKIAANWLKALVQTHSSQLMALGSEDLLRKFGPCIGIIEYRTNCLKDLSKLNGRLQLLVSQIKRNVADEDTLNNKDCLVYEDESNENSEIEDNEMVEKNDDASSVDEDWEQNEDDQMEEDQADDSSEDDEDENMSSS